MKKTTVALIFCLFMILTVCYYDISISDTTNIISTNIISTVNSAEVINDDFKTQSPAWKSYSGEWKFKDGELIQTGVTDYFPTILREDHVFSDLEISVNFKPISGNIDASGGIIFRARNKDNYYIIRANALENNYRLYTFTNGYRRQIASARVTPPDLGKFHNMRVVAKGDHIQAYLNGELKLDCHDDSYKDGYTGLWTKADSVTAFNTFKVSRLTK